MMHTICVLYFRPLTRLLRARAGTGGGGGGKLPGPSAPPPLWLLPAGGAPGPALAPWVPSALHAHSCTSIPSFLPTPFFCPHFFSPQPPPPSYQATALPPQPVLSFSFRIQSYPSHFSRLLPDLRRLRLILLTGARGQHGAAPLEGSRWRPCSRCRPSAFSGSPCVAWVPLDQPGSRPARTCCKVGVASRTSTSLDFKKKLCWRVDGRD